MKTYCKNIDITDTDTIKAFVFDYLTTSGNKGVNWKRNDFLDLIESYTPYRRNYLLNLESNGLLICLNIISELLSQEISNRIKNKDLKLSPIRFFKRIDGISLKEREISNESPMQRIMDYIAVESLMPLFKAKIVYHQYASIKGKGQIVGKRAIERWVRRKKDSKFFCKLDIEKCFNSITKETVMKFLKRDIHKNSVLLWYVSALLNTYKKYEDGKLISCGLVIGTLLSQWLCNYLLSYLYRYIDGLFRIRKSKNNSIIRVKLVKHILFYMDDVLLLDNRRTDLKSAIRKTIQWAKENLELTIHNNWAIKSIKEPIDMMGFVIRFESTTIRERIFLRARRQFIRAWKDIKTNKYLSKTRAYKIISYAGYFIHSNSKYFKKKYHFEIIKSKAKKSISYWSKIDRYYKMKALVV